MEIILLVLIVLLILALRGSISTNNDLIRSLKNTVDHLQDDIRQLNSKIAALPKPQPSDEIKGTSPAPSVVTTTEVEEDPVSPPVIETKVEVPSPVMTAVEERSVVIEAPAPFPETPIEGEGSFDRWLRNNPDIEKFIGENLINKIGIAVLVLGIAFFVRYAIDQDWINETGRVGIGLLCGGSLIGLAHRLRNSYRSFSSVLVGGGLTVFYFTIAFAFHEYKLVSQPVAFIAMLVITAFAVLLSILYNRIELAILATIGGFITPFLVSTGSNNHVALFTYLCVLNAGLILLAYFRNWKLLNLIALFFTLLIYGIWFTRVAVAGTIPYADALLFASIFYFMFIAMNLASQFSIKDKLRAWDFGVLLIINSSYYSVGLLILDEWGLTHWNGLFTATLGIVNLVLAYVLFRSKSLDRNFIYLLIGLTVTYISLTAPAQLEGNQITLFWAAEAVVLLWLYQRSFIRLIKVSAAIVTACMLISLLIDWGQLYDPGNGKLLNIVLNKGVITSLFVSASLLISHRLLRKEADTYYLSFITNAALRITYFCTAIAICFLAGMIEINYQFTQRFPDTGLHYIYLQLYAISFFTALFFLSETTRFKMNGQLKLVLTGSLFLFYLGNATNVYQAETAMLLGGKHTEHLFAGIFNAIAVTAMLLHTLFSIVADREKFRNIFKTLVTCVAIALVVMISIEVRNGFIWSAYDHPSDIERFDNLYAKAILSIIWGVSSFFMIWIGMKYRFKSLRITALVLFGITIIKLFTYDISNIPPGGKIAAFILLGILLLVVSFMYQRLKKLIIDVPEVH